jgi:hypothetical protein
MIRIRRTGRGQRGHAMLELAASAAVMVACLGGTFQFGYTFYVYNQLVTAVGNPPPFYLAYHEENNRPLLQRYGSLCARIMASWLARRCPSDRRPRSSSQI